MNLLNTRHFCTLVRYYKLQEYLDYYLLHNQSIYINSYHGYEHVKKIICSIHERTGRDGTWHYEEVKCMMIAAIFHDFNYVGVDYNNPNYDSINIREALNGYEVFCALTERTVDRTVLQIIKDSEYPAYKTANLNILSRVFVECDHSMIIHDGYPFMGVMYAMQECGMNDYNNIVSNALPYFNAATFTNDYFQAIWNENKADILSDFKELANTLCRDNFFVPSPFRGWRWERYHWLDMVGFAYNYGFEIVNYNCNQRIQ